MNHLRTIDEMIDYLKRCELKPRRMNEDGFTFIRISLDRHRDHLHRIMDTLYEWGHWSITNVNESFYKIRPFTEDELKERYEK